MPGITMVCEENCTSQQSSVQWSESAFVLVASCTTTVAAALNLGLFASVVVGGLASRHPITLQLCACAVIACAALSCHVRRAWWDAEDPPSSPCRALGLASLSSHCAFLTLLSAETRWRPDRRVVVLLLAVVSWCVTGIVTLAAGVLRAPSSALLVFCLYVLHIPLAALLAIAPRRSVRPLGAAVPPPDVRRIVAAQLLLFFVGTMPQAFLAAAEALDLGPFRSADAWCCLLTALFAALRPLMDAAVRPELGDAAAELIGALFRRRRCKRTSADADEP